MKQKQRMIFLILCIVMTLSMLPVPFGAESNPVNGNRGEEGSNVTGLPPKKTQKSILRYEKR